MFPSLVPKENLSCKRGKSLVTLGENCVKDTDTAVVECYPSSSRKSLRLQGHSGISLSLEIPKTFAESSSKDFGEHPGCEQTAQVRREKTLQTNRTCFHERRLVWFCFNFTSFGEFQAKTKRERENGLAKTKGIETEETDMDSNMEFPSHSQVKKL